MTAGEGVGQLARQRWDQACSRADLALREARTAASAAGVDWLVRWFTTEISQLATLQAAVDGKRRKPGTGSSGLIYDFPPDLQLPEYEPSLAALAEVQRLFDRDLDISSGWNWADGFPPDWPASAKDRLRAVITWHST